MHATPFIFTAKKKKKRKKKHKMSSASDECYNIIDGLRDYDKKGYRRFNSNMVIELLHKYGTMSNNQVEVKMNEIMEKSKIILTGRLGIVISQCKTSYLKRFIKITKSGRMRLKSKYRALINDNIKGFFFNHGKFELTEYQKREMEIKNEDELEEIAIREFDEQQVVLDEDELQEEEEEEIDDGGDVDIYYVNKLVLPKPLVLDEEPLIDETDDEEEEENLISISPPVKNSVGVSTFTPVKNSVGVSTFAPVKNSVGVSTFAPVKKSVGISTFTPVKNSVGISTFTPVKNSVGISAISPVQSFVGIYTVPDDSKNQRKISKKYFEEMKYHRKRARELEKEVEEKSKKLKMFEERDSKRRKIMDENDFENFAYNMLNSDIYSDEDKLLFGTDLFFVN
jgi:hypothetical protein